MIDLSSPKTSLAHGAAFLISCMHEARAAGQSDFASAIEADMAAAVYLSWYILAPEMQARINAELAAIGKTPIGGAQ